MVVAAACIGYAAMAVIATAGGIAPAGPDITPGAGAVAYAGGIACGNACAATDESSGTATGESTGTATGKRACAATGKSTGTTTGKSMAAATSVSTAALGIAGHACEGKEHDRHYELRFHNIHFSQNRLRVPDLDEPTGRWFNLRKKREKNSPGRNILQ
jgi:hypothetical protein